MHNDMQMIQTVKQSHRNDGVPTGPSYGKIKAHPYGATKPCFFLLWCTEDTKACQYSSTEYEPRDGWILGQFQWQRNYWKKHLFFFFFNKTGVILERLLYYP